MAKAKKRVAARKKSSKSGKASANLWLSLDSLPVPYARLSTFSDGHFRTGENLRTDWEERTLFWWDMVNVTLDLSFSS